MVPIPNNYVIIKGHDPIYGFANNAKDEVISLQKWKDASIIEMSIVTIKYATAIGCLKEHCRRAFRRKSSDARNGSFQGKADTRPCCLGDMDEDNQSKRPFARRQQRWRRHRAQYAFLGMTVSTIPCYA